MEKCCICHQPIQGFSCNAEPLASGRCCGDCDDDFVTPVRLLRAGIKRDVVRGVSAATKEAARELRRLMGGES